MSKFRLRNPRSSLRVRGQVAMYQPMLGGWNRKCSYCNRPDRLEVELAALSGYGPALWEREKDIAAADRATSKHWWHLAEVFMAEPSVVNGTHGAKMLDAFDEALRTARKIIKQARREKNLAIAMEGCRVIASIGESQAKIAGLMPVKGKGGAHLHLHAPGQQITAQQALAVLEDLRATHEPEASSGESTDGAPFLPSE